jgi:hypothetical protein
VWRRGADGKMERVSLSVICQEYKSSIATCLP